MTLKNQGRDARRASRSTRCLYVSAAALALAGVGCTDAGGAAASSPAPEISDQLHSGGTQGFFWLPSIVPNPAPYGENEPAADPTVRIDEIDPATGATIRTVATFTRASGPSGERTRIKLRGHPCDADDDDDDRDDQGYFYARWRPNDNPSLALRAIYRVHVLVPGGRELGFADVDVVRNNREFRGVDRDDFVPLILGQTLRIKFRVAHATVDVDGDGVLDWNDNCPSAANPDQIDTVGNHVGDACRCASVTCAASDQCHVAGVCQPTTGACTNPAAADGTTCDDQNACTRSDACSAGACLGSDPVTCTALDACHTAGACDPATGTCSNPAAPSGTACGDDGNPCTLDRCDSAGVCAHRTPGVADALTPSAVPSGGLAMWLEADQGVTTNASGLVSRWADQSGHGRDAAQTNPLYQPALVGANPEVGGRPTVRFALGANGLSGQGQTLPFDGSFIANTDYTVFAVAARDRGGPYGSGNDAQALANFFVTGSSAAANSSFIVGWENGTTLRFSQFANDLDLTVPAWNGSRMWSLMTFLLDGGAGRSTFLGVTQSAGASNTNRTRLASNAGANIGRFAATQYWFQGDVAELVFFDHALTCSERMAVEQYLAGKYSLP